MGENRNSIFDLSSIGQLIGPRKRDNRSIIGDRTMSMEITQKLHVVKLHCIKYYIFVIYVKYLNGWMPIMAYD